MMIATDQNVDVSLIVLYADKSYREIFKMQDWQMAVSPAIPSLEVELWINNNVTGNYRCLGQLWYFQLLSDFLAFKLRWC